LSENRQSYRRKRVYVLISSSVLLLPLIARAGGPYTGQAYHDSVYHAGPQTIPGRVMCAYYDLGGEGVAYHDSDATNKGSGTLNPADGSYLNEFRIHEGVDTSYTKYHDDIDNNPYEAVHPPKDLLYVGWTDPGEWFNLTVNVKESALYNVNLLYTSKNGGAISLDLDGKTLGGLIRIDSTYNAQDPIAWRQWHHWNYGRAVASVTLPKGNHVLTLHIVLEGNMNLAYLDFSKAD
jgi:Carbohydrate binding module (family 6)